MTSPYQEPKIEERMEEANEPDIAVGTFFIGVVVGAVLLVFIFIMNDCIRRPTVKEIKDDKILIICDDESTEWYTLPSCRGPDKKDRR